MQTGTIQGKFSINSGIALTDLENRLVKMADGGSIPEVLLPTDVADFALYVVEKGGALDEDSDVIPLCDGQQVLLRAQGTGSAGNTLVLAAVGGDDVGKVEAVTATADTYFSPGIAEEDFVDEQLVKVRVFKRTVIVT